MESGTEKIEDGFTWPIESNSGQKWRIEWLNVQETILVDFTKDKNLCQFLEDCDQKFDKEGILKLGKVEKVEFIKLFMLFVSDFFGGIEKRDISHQCESKISKMLEEKKDRFILLGELKGCGICRHRSILFKILCDRFEIPCRIVDGLCVRRKEGGRKHVKRTHMWNEVVFSSNDTMIVDCFDYIGDSANVYSTYQNDLEYRNLSDYFRKTDELMREANDHFSNGRFTETKKVLSDLHKLVSSQEEVDREDFIIFLCLFKMGECDEVLGDKGQALSKFRECINLCKIMSANSKGDKTLVMRCFQNIASSLSKVGNLLIDQKKLEHARSYLQKSVKYWKRIEPKTMSVHIGLAYDCHGLGEVYVTEKKYLQALGVLNECLKIRKQVFGDKDIDVAKTLVLMGRTCHEMNNFPGCVKQMLSAESIFDFLQEKKGSSVELQTFLPYKNFIYDKLGSSFYQMSKFDDSIKYFKLSLEVLRKISSMSFSQNQNNETQNEKNKQNIVNCLILIGGIYEYNLCDYSSALIYYEMGARFSPVLQENIRRVRGLINKSSEVSAGSRSCAYCKVVEAFVKLEKKFGICSRCKEVYYCCRDHQKRHWKVHKKVCIKQ